MNVVIQGTVIEFDGDYDEIVVDDASKPDEYRKPMIIYRAGEIACLSNLNKKYEKKAWANAYTGKNKHIKKYKGINVNTVNRVIQIPVAKLKAQLK